MIERRRFLRSGIVSALTATAAGLTCRQCWSTNVEQGDVRWQASQDGKFFVQVFCDGTPCQAEYNPLGLLSVELQLWENGRRVGLPAALHHNQPVTRLGPVEARLSHRLADALGNGKKTALEATVLLRNKAQQPVQVEVRFVTSATPPGCPTNQPLYLPLSAAGLSHDRRLAPLGSQEFLGDCRQTVSSPHFECHYLEPMASYPNHRTTRALLLVPVIDIGEDGHWKLALFSVSDRPARFWFEARGSVPERRWQLGRVVTVAPGSELTERAWLFPHKGNATVAWRAFHRLAHHEDLPPVSWPQQFRVHYYDFLSSAEGKNGRRGNGYEADLPYFRQFHVGMATQHGYYETIGNYVHPKRKQWLAMQSDPQGPALMSLEKMRARIQATRETGARAAIYMHTTLFDDAAANFKELEDAVRREEDGSLSRFGWQGPDIKGKSVWMSVASPQWQEHFLQQAQWIMELLDPDAIVVDETFLGLGYDFHPDRKGPTSAGAIELFRKLRKLVRSYGEQKVVFASDCVISSMCLWLDGEAGDHAYPNLLGHKQFLQEPIRYLAALGDKPWRPCAWMFVRMWDRQMALARAAGAGVGVANGWIEYTGLHNLPEKTRNRLIADIESLL